MKKTVVVLAALSLCTPALCRALPSYNGGRTLPSYNGGHTLPSYNGGRTLPEHDSYQKQGGGTPPASQAPVAPAANGGPAWPGSNGYPSWGGGSSGAGFDSPARQTPVAPSGTSEMLQQRLRVLEEQLKQLQEAVVPCGDSCSEGRVIKWVVTPQGPINGQPRYSIQWERMYGRNCDKTCSGGTSGAMSPYPR